MKLCVGATSRLVVETAAKMDVPQIVASRRQVNSEGGYIGLTQHELVELVRAHSSVTQVVRDHGGPHQNGQQERSDEWLTELEEDIAAGFDVLHLDVSRLPLEQRYDELGAMLDVIGDHPYEVGGERDDILHNMSLAAYAEDISDRRPVAVVADTGGHVWADRQMGLLPDPQFLAHAREDYPLKAHNMDWVGARRRWEGAVEYMNIAPELGLLETEAWLREMDGDAARLMLEVAYHRKYWTRWFNDDEGTWYSRAVCSLRYMQTDLSWLEAMAGVSARGHSRVVTTLAQAMERWT